MFNEELAPYGHDDPELAIRIIKTGYHNAVFSVKFESDVDWGGTRTTPHPELNSIVKRNMNYIRKWYAEELNDICMRSQPLQVVKVNGMTTPTEEMESKKIWRSKIKRRYFGWLISFWAKIISFFKVRH